MSVAAKCPQCKKQIEFNGNPYKPFCSERCKMIDLGAWVTGQYVVKREDCEEEDGL